MPKPRKTTKYSYGIACYRYNSKGLLEVLLIQKRVTYAFSEFVMGLYDPADNDRLRYLFNHMTAEEKNDITSLNFSRVWYRNWLFRQQNTCGYYASCEKYRTLTADGGTRISNLLLGTNNATLCWDIPKGRRAGEELSIDTAIREFIEETGLKRDDFIVYPFNEFQTMSTDCGITYNTGAFPAIIRNEVRARNNFGYTNNDEILQSKWFDAAELRCVPGVGAHLLPLLRKTQNFIRKRNPPL